MCLIDCGATEAKPGILNLGPAAFLCLASPVPKHRPEVKGPRHHPTPFPGANPLREVRDALVRTRTYFMTVPGNAPTSVSAVTALEAPRSHDAAQHSLLSAADRSPSSTCLNNDVQPSVHVFHVKPGLSHSSATRDTFQFTTHHGTTKERGRVSRETRCGRP